MNNNKKFVGFGFGPIQAGLMVYEAYKSGNFNSFTIAEIDQKLVDAIRLNNNQVTINIATESGIQSHTIGPILLYNPTVADDRIKIGRAIFEADELATAIPSVDFYVKGGDASIVSQLFKNLNPDKNQILYASENNNFAAEVLEEELFKIIPRKSLPKFQALNTVIGKMSGIKLMNDPSTPAGIKPIVPHWDKALLVESFNRILISKITLTDCTCGIPAFTQKDDLLPFEEAKLHGHNAIHSLLGYLANERGYKVMSDIRADRKLYEIGRKAFIDECGAALIKKYGATGDPLFTPAGFTAYADDLLVRMTNPYLKDEVSRIIRDPQRKLGLNDRLFGTMRLCLQMGIVPEILAHGSLAAVRYLVDQNIDVGCGLPDVNNSFDEKWINKICLMLWKNDMVDNLLENCLELIVKTFKSGRGSVNK